MCKSLLGFSRWNPEPPARGFWKIPLGIWCGKLKVSSTGALLKWSVKKTLSKFFQHLKCRHFHLSNILLTMSLAYLWPEIDTRVKMWILIPVLPSSSEYFEPEISEPSEFSDQSKYSEYVLSFFGTIRIFWRIEFSPPEYSDDLKFSSPEYSDDLEFSDVLTCWSWTKNFVTKNYCL